MGRTYVSFWNKLLRETNRHDKVMMLMLCQWYNISVVVCVFHSKVNLLNLFIFPIHSIFVSICYNGTYALQYDKNE